MNSIENYRQKIMARHQTLHNVAYSAIPVGYPNLPSIDFENFTGQFFVTVELNPGKTIQPADGTGLSVRADGELKVATIGKEKTGTKWATAYTDMLIAGLLSQTHDGVNYTGIRTIQMKPYPGYFGVMNIITLCAL
jgi:hypothetical protein